MAMTMTKQWVVYYECAERSKGTFYVQAPNFEIAFHKAMECKADVGTNVILRGIYFKGNALADQVAAA